MKPRIRYAGMTSRGPQWTVTFTPGIVLHFGTFVRACQFAGQLK